jgi:hypothetical protein
VTNTGREPQLSLGRESPKKLYEEVIAKYRLDDSFERLVVLKAALEARRLEALRGAGQLLGRTTSAVTPLQVLSDVLEFSRGFVDPRPELV